MSRKPREFNPIERQPYRGPALGNFKMQAGAHIEMERARAGRMGVPLINTPGLRYCECCKSRKPRGKRPAKKGWKCDECLTAAARKIAEMRR